MVISSHGYAGNILRVDLTSGKIAQEALEENIPRKYLGGVGIGVHYLYKEVPPGNRVLRSRESFDHHNGATNGYQDWRHRRVRRRN